MKKEISSMDLHFLVKEFQVLIGGKLDQVYQRAKEELVFQIHVPNTGKKTLRVLPGRLIYLATQKGQMPQKPPGFCVYLRKYLKGTRIRSIRQLDFERVIEIDLEAKEQKYKILLELFSKGNVVVCDKDYTIFSVLDVQHRSGRTIKTKEKYIPPKRDYDFLSLNKEQLKQLCEDSDKESVVKTLAIELGLGGVYSEELCSLAKIDKTIPSKDLKQSEVNRLFDAMIRLRGYKASPRQIFKDKTLKDIMPIKLDYYTDLEQKEFEDFNSALDDFFTEHELTQNKEVVSKIVTKKLDKISVMIGEQERRIKGLEKSAEENQRKGEFIFENYVEVDTILKTIKEMRKKQSWKEVKETLKSDNRIKSIDEKTGDITIEI